jgi:hypothetical protein
MVVPLTAYFDASGTAREHPIWTVGGWLATVEQWTQFSHAWREMLDAAPFREGVKHIYHATELESLKGIYSDWTEARKREFQDTAYSLIGRYPFLAISSSVIKADWKALRIQLSSTVEGHPANFYLHSVLDVLGSVRKWAEVENYRGRIHYVFEIDTIGQPQVHQLLKEIHDDSKRRQLHRMEGWSFDGKEVLPLHAADIWAYEAYKYMMNRGITKPLRKPRYPLMRLFRDEYKPYNKYWDRESLERLIKKCHEGG